MKMKKIVNAISALTIAVSAFAAMAISANAADTYTVLYGVPTETDGVVTGVTAQGDFTGDANETTTTFVDANGNSAALPMEGSALAISKAGGWTKKFDAPVTTGKVYFSATYYVSANNSPGNIQLRDSAENIIFASASNNTGNNANQTVATICGTEIVSYVRQPRKAAYKFDICVDLDANTLTYTLLVSSSKNSYDTKTGTVALTSDNVAGLTVTKSEYNAAFDNVALYSVVSGETKYDYTVDYQFNGESVKTDEAAVLENTVITADTSFFADGQKYYITTDEAPTLTVSATGDNTLVVPVRLANNYSLTVNAVGDVEKNLVTKTVVEGEKASWAIPMYIVEDGVAYEATPVSDTVYYGANIAAMTENVAAEVTYTKKYENVVIYDDCDSTNGRNADVRASNRSAYDNAGYTSADLEPGIYTVVVRHEYIGRGSEMTIGDQTVITYNTDRKNAWVTDTATDVVVTEAAPLVWGGTATTDPIDTILVIKTGDLEPPAAAFTAETSDAIVAEGTGAYAETVATGFKATVTNTGDAEGSFSTVNWAVTSPVKNGTANISQSTTMTLAVDAEAIFGLIIDGLYDAAATATVTVE